MKSYLPDYELRPARTIDEALELLAEDGGDWRPFAGGTDLMVLLEAGMLQHRRFVSLWALDELRGISVDVEHVTLGALVTYTDMRTHERLRAEFPMLEAAASQTGGVATQNRGTIGGNIANASPAADTPPALLVYDAELELLSVRGSRRVPYATFHRGYKQMDLAPGEIIARIRLPRRPPGWIERYEKVGTRRAQAISKVCMAAAARLEGGRVADARIAFGSVAPAVVRCAHAEAALRGKAPGTATKAVIEALAKDVAPIDDIRSTAAYRLRISQNLLADYLRGLEEQ